MRNLYLIRNLYLMRNLYSMRDFYLPVETTAMQNPTRQLKPATKKPRINIFANPLLTSLGLQQEGLHAKTPTLKLPRQDSFFQAID